MYKSKPICPVCGKSFNPKNPVEHINEYHKNASDKQLMQIRDERRKYYKQPFNGKKKSTGLLPNTAIYSVSHSKANKISASW